MTYNEKTGKTHGQLKSERHISYSLCNKHEGSDQSDCQRKSSLQVLVHACQSERIKYWQINDLHDRHDNTDGHNNHPILHAVIEDFGRKAKNRHCRHEGGDERKCNGYGSHASSGHQILISRRLLSLSRSRKEEADGNRSNDCQQKDDVINSSKLVLGHCTGDGKRTDTTAVSYRYV